MAYCRWSTDLFQCDLYLYYSVGGFYSVNIASVRRRYLSPLPSASGGDYADAYMKVMGMEEGKDYVFEPIDSKHAGESYEIADDDDLIYLLKELKADGINFPDEVITMVWIESMREKYLHT